MWSRWERKTTDINVQRCNSFSRFKVSRTNISCKVLKAKTTYLYLLSNNYIQLNSSIKPHKVTNPTNEGNNRTECRTFQPVNSLILKTETSLPTLYVQQNIVYAFFKKINMLCRKDTSAMLHIRCRNPALQLWWQSRKHLFPAFSISKVHKMICHDWKIEPNIAICQSLNAELLNLTVAKERMKLKKTHEGYTSSQDPFLSNSEFVFAQSSALHTLKVYKEEALNVQKNAKQQGLIRRGVNMKIKVVLWSITLLYNWRSIILLNFQ